MKLLKGQREMAVLAHPTCPNPNFTETPQKPNSPSSALPPLAVLGTAPHVPDCKQLTDLEKKLGTRSTELS
jgi:hypothetical protein